MYGYGFLSRGFTDRREILHGSSATSRTGFLPFWGDGPRDGRVMGVNRGHMQCDLSDLFFSVTVVVTVNKNISVTVTVNATF